MGRVSADTAQRVFLKPQITQIPQIQHTENDPLHLSYL